MPHNLAAIFTAAVAIGSIALLVRDNIPAAMVLLGADVLLLLTRVIDTTQAFSGFANPAVVTIAALFVLARAVDKTGALQPMVSRALGNGEGRASLARLLIPTAFASAVLNNTPIVAMLAPQVSDWAEKRGLSPSRYLMPISFATILGGTITLIGTSTNLVASGLLEKAGYAPIGMFEMTRVGLPVAIVGLVVLIVFAPILLPDRRGARQQVKDEYREYVLHMNVVPGGPFDGATVEGAGLRHLQGVFLAEVRRNDAVIAAAGPDTVLRGDDHLMFVGRVDMVRDLQMMRGLSSTERKHALGVDAPGHTFFEAVISGASSLVGRTLAESEFRSRFHAVVIAIHRAGARVNEKLGSVKLQEGDTIMILSDGSFPERWRDHREFLLVSHLGGSLSVSKRKAALVGAITLGVVVVAGLGLLPMVQTALLGVILLLMTGVLTTADVRDALDFDVLMVIAASFGVGAAIEKSGLAAMLGHFLVRECQGAGPVGVLAAVILATVLLTELITNNAAAVLMFPIGVATAHELAVNPRPFVIALTVAASASFLTPIGYQTNTMVYGPGGYKFSDFARLGFPLTFAVMAVLVIFVPHFWPF